MYSIIFFVCARAFLFLIFLRSLVLFICLFEVALRCELKQSKVYLLMEEKYNFIISRRV